MNVQRVPCSHAAETGDLNLAPQRKPTIEPIDNNQRFAAASSILRTLENGLAVIEAEIDAQKVEEHLGRQPKDHRNKPRPDSRNAVLQARLDRHREKAPAKQVDQTVADGMSDSVVAALEIIRGSRPPSRVSRQKLIEQLETDRAAVRAAIFIQAPIVDELRNELDALQSMKDRDEWFDIQLQKQRDKQRLAATGDREADFIKSRIDAGYRWRGDLLPQIGARSMLVLGSERDWNSEISRSRRELEEAKVL